MAAAAPAVMVFRTRAPKWMRAAYVAAMAAVVPGATVFRTRVSNWMRAAYVAAMATVTQEAALVARSLPEMLAVMPATKNLAFLALIRNAKINVKSRGGQAVAICMALTPKPAIG